MEAQKSKASPGHALQKTYIEKCASSLKNPKNGATDDGR